MNIQVPAYSQPLSANGDATGYLTVASSVGFYAGCRGFISSDNQSQRVVITEVKDATHVGARVIADDNEQQGSQQRYGGRSDFSAYTTALHSTLWMEDQLARVEPQMQSLLKPNV